MSKSQKPTGLNITRDGLKFTFEWKHGESYADGQVVQYQLHTTLSQDTAPAIRMLIAEGYALQAIPWHSITVTKNATSAVLNLTASDFYPYTEKRICGIRFRVKGNRGEYTKKGKKYNPGWSDWATIGRVINPPKVPTISASWGGDPVNRSTYEWEVKNEQWYPATNILLQSIPKQDCPLSKMGALAEWDEAEDVTKPLTDSTYYDEDGLNGISKARLVRVRARGIGGYSDSWAYAYHVFAAPLSVKALSGTALYNKTTHVWNLSATWEKSETETHPVDNYMLQYRIGKPSAGMGVTTDGSWTDTSPTTGGDTAVQITEALNPDECLWLRVTASHDNHTGAQAVASDPIRPYTGEPAAPTALAISASDPSTHEVTIAVTNNSQITDSKIAIVFQPTTKPEDSVIVAVLTGSGSISQSGIKCPDWSGTGTLGFRAYAYVGSESYATKNGVKYYNVMPEMKSTTIYTTGGIPKAPASVTAEKVGEEIRVDWDWTWQDANAAEVSWSTRPTAWNSNGGPETYKVSATGPAHLYITGLEEGKTYYIRVRLLAEEDGETTYSEYSDIVQVYMATAPVIPTLDLSAYSINEGDEITASWIYTSMDGTPQAYAKILERTGQNTYVTVAETATSQQLTFKPDWQQDTQHDLYLEVTSESGMPSPLSNVQTVTVVAKPSCTITEASLVSGDEGYELSQMPLTVTVTGAGTAGQTLILIVRSEDFVEERPGGEDFNGFKGETVMRREYLGEAQQTIETEDLIGHLDDTAPYRLIAQVTDEYGQEASDAIDFTVNWAEQPVPPEATVEIVDRAAYITVIEPETGGHNTDTVDIYRLSIDGPTLLYADAKYGDVIVDPYPVIGEFGGYRLATKTKNGDYYTAEKEPSWIDIEAGFDSISQFIDFDGHTLPLTYNVDLDASFQKNFKKTVYMGGHEAGDYLKGINRTGTIAAAQITEEDTDDLQTLRALSGYSGLAHIRSKDGSSYWANVNTADGLDHMSCRMFKSITLQIEAVKVDRPDGLPQADWEVGP